MGRAGGVKAGTAALRYELDDLRRQLDAANKQLEQVMKRNRRLLPAVLAAQKVAREGKQWVLDKEWFVDLEMTCEHALDEMERVT